MSLANAQSMLAQTMSSVMQRTMEERRVYTESQADLMIRDGFAQGTVDLEGVGESIVDIAFPIKFLEPPIFAPGLELRGSVSLAAGSFPIWAATIANWFTENLSSSVLYVGAAVAVVVLDAPRSKLHYSFSGRSYRTPVDSSTNVSQTL